MADKPYYLTQISGKDFPSYGDYFVLRLDESNNNEQCKAARIAINAYADAIRDHNPELADSLKQRYPLL